MSELNMICHMADECKYYAIDGVVCNEGDYIYCMIERKRRKRKMSENVYRCPCCGKTFTKKESDKIFINSFIITDFEGMIIAQRMKHIILMDKIKDIDKNTSYFIPKKKEKVNGENKR